MTPVYNRLQTMTRRIGIYSGTFDPVHSGHVAFALAAQRACDLERVILLPERRPRSKHKAAAFPHRVAMLELAVASHPQLSVLQLDEEQLSVADTLPKLQQHFPGDNLALLLGSDVVKGLDTWPDVGELIKAINLIIGLRQADNIIELRKALDKLQAKYDVIQAPNAHLASSHIRTQKLQDLDPSVASYITQHSLYKV